MSSGQRSQSSASHTHHSSIPPRAPRKRSHKSRNIMNQSFNFNLFPWGALSESRSSSRGVLEQPFFDLSSYGRQCSFEAGEKMDTCRPAWRSRTWLQAPMWSRLFFIFTLYEANGICSWLTSNLEKWSSLGSQLAGRRLHVLLKWVRQQQVFAHKSRGPEKWVWEGESLGSTDSQQAQRQTTWASDLHK